MSKDKPAKIATPQPVRGTQDMLGDFADRFQHVVDTFDRVRRLYGFKRIEVPVIEPTAVFARSLGETTDVVSKEMYSFEDRGGESITLRPEFTAGIARAYITGGWQQFAPLKVATHGPLFRYERPQKGRYRQFHQLDAEVIGSDSPLADAELLVFADQLLKELGIAEGVTLTLNTLGDAASRDAWRAALVEHFMGHRGDLSEDSLARLDKNPLRILDSKDPKDRPIADSAPDIDAFLTGEAQDFFGAVTAGLDAAGVAWERNARLVRGLDYYRHTAFEFVTDRLGAQGTVLGGGRYDGLIEALGGPPTAAVGWAAGIERLAMLLPEVARSVTDVIVVIEDDAVVPLGISILQTLREDGLSAEMIATGSARKRFDKASKLNPRGILSLGGTGTSAAPIRSSDEALTERVASLIFERHFEGK
ncbi:MULTISPECIES: histidine--tRNA ligase [unclassified Sphingopyxis]|uniref:histidine--tRNA ligase n=1 Tax=unclassified Sphingopyxis TaxID=2614943 RepID=UPI0007302BAB|nr:MULTISPECIES: histidine--tRNA ligase [unclassified Sphingopyxis]KTE25951.1 histidyl-tRNA synthetase [Sphingopyxis sp. H057]KTE48919.1 histidyl-tRNA synthetase [Sphingopyxis sp. H071]KTE51631.1 histidyl-tRNA synthetase [Sphingopyxis sp. H073]KTE52421.1 histidyl-tRNA synthetase [Sphingopyxis sp. H107]KTE65355.1 histidyl-tRNA synthetase [Sphingopyxis sp. H081]